MATGSTNVRTGRLRREHFVAASLVGTVVVVVGFASGLGLRQTPSGTAQAQAAPPARTPTAGPVQTTSTQPPSGGGGGGGYVGGGGGGLPAPQPIQRQPDPVVPSHPHPSTPPTTTPPSTPPSLPPCDPGVLRSLVDTVDNSVGSLTGLLGLPLGQQPLDPLLTPVLDPLLGTPCLPPPPSVPVSTPPR